MTNEQRHREMLAEVSRDPLSCPPPWSGIEWNGFTLRGEEVVLALMSRAAAEARKQALREAAAIADKWATDEQRVHGLGGPEKAILALIDKKEGE